jgi:Protein of unknown function (DUF3562)
MAAAPSIAKHQQLIESLAAEANAPLEHVRQIFEHEHARLHSDERVKTFVTVIAARLVRETSHAERAGRA